MSGPVGKVGTEYLLAENTCPERDPAHRTARTVPTSGVWPARHSQVANNVRLIQLKKIEARKQISPLGDVVVEQSDEFVVPNIPCGH